VSEEYFEVSLATPIRLFFLARSTPTTKAVDLPFRKDSGDAEIIFYVLIRERVGVTSAGRMKI
jgi:hypothetical protein